MDFRRVDLTTLQWAKRGCKATVQTPLCGCRVTKAGLDALRLDVSLLPHVPQHAAFCEWLERAEEAAEAALSPQRPRSSCVFRGNLRLMAFKGSVRVYDHDADEWAGDEDDLLSASSVACVIDLQGIWTTDNRWGLRWRVSEVRFSRAAPELPAPPECGGGGGEDDDCVFDDCVLLPD
jgi:hypothetical protein